MSNATNESSSTSISSSCSSGCVWAHGCAVRPSSWLRHSLTTVFLVLILNAYAFPERGLTGAVSLLLVALALAAAFGLALPMRRLRVGGPRRWRKPPTRNWSSGC